MIEIQCQILRKENWKRKYDSKSDDNMKNINIRERERERDVVIVGAGNSWIDCMCAGASQASDQESQKTTVAVCHRARQQKTWQNVWQEGQIANTRNAEISRDRQTDIYRRIDTDTHTEETHKHRQSYTHAQTPALETHLTATLFRESDHWYRLCSQPRPVYCHAHMQLKKFLHCRILDDVVSYAMRK